MGRMGFQVQFLEVELRKDSVSKVFKGLDLAGFYLFIWIWTSEEGLGEVLFGGCLLVCDYASIFEVVKQEVGWVG